MPSSACQTCARSEEHTSELQSHDNLVCRLLLEKKTDLAPQSEDTAPPALASAVPLRDDHCSAYLSGCALPLGVESRLSACLCSFFFFFKKTAPPEISPFSPPAALPT